MELTDKYAKSKYCIYCGTEKKEDFKTTLWCSEQCKEIIINYRIRCV